jgi:hypothetical protein
MGLADRATGVIDIGWQFKEAVRATLGLHGQ